MAIDTYDQRDLAWVHHSGYSHHVERTCAGIVQLLHDGGLSAGARVLDVGCGSGLLARELLTAGFSVHAVDASPAMIELARDYAPGATSMWCDCRPGCRQAPMARCPTPKPSCRRDTCSIIWTRATISLRHWASWRAPCGRRECSRLI